MTSITIFIVLYFFIAGAIFGYGIGTGDVPKKNDPWILRALFILSIVFWPLAVLGGLLLENK